VPHVPPTSTSTRNTNARKNNFKILTQVYTSEEGQRLEMSHLKHDASVQRNITGNTGAKKILKDLRFS
jgi:hypothetical protein